MSRLVIAFLSLVSVGIFFTPAQAGPITLQCGDTVGPGGKFTLAAPVGPCATAGIIVNSATLDMNHLSVTCTGGTFSGVTVIGNGAVVKNGQVSGCLNGFEVQGSGHKVKGNFALGNVNNGFEVQSADTKLVKNTAGTNGAEGFHVAENTNTLKKNTSNANSHNGIDIQSGGNSIKNNIARNNGSHGIAVGLGFTGNTISEDTATDNTDEDLFDGNGGCANNKWKNNTFVTKNPNCIQ